MIAHNHGKLWNAVEIAGSLGVSHPTARSYLDLMCATFVARRLRPFAENVGKRVVKTPKIYLSDTGLLHAMLGISSMRDLQGNPKLGASWEGFVIDQVVQHLGARPDEVYFWATHGGAELDLLIVRGRQRVGFEIKRTDQPKLTQSMLAAIDSLRLDRLTVIHAGEHRFSLRNDIEAVPAAQVLTLPKL